MFAVFRKFRKLYIDLKKSLKKFWFVSYQPVLIGFNESKAKLLEGNC